MKTEKKETAKSIAARHGVTERTIKRYKADGINIYNDADIELHKASMSYVGANETPDVEDALDLKMRKLKYETSIKKSEDILKDLQVKEKQGELVSVNEVAEINTEIASKVKAQLKKLSLSLPPRLLGLDVKAMSKIIEESIYETLEFLHGELSIECDESVDN